MIAVSVLLALLLDMILGEPKRWHPLVGFGWLANCVERWMNQSSMSSVFQLLLGALAWFLLIIPLTVVLILGIAYLEKLIGLSWLIDGVIVYWVIGYTSLRQHTLAIFAPLVDGNIVLAREKLSFIVSRDTEALDAEAIRKATIESVLENGSDAIFAPLFWFVVGGVPAVFIYRLSNTLDAMWGYKYSRYLFFGRFSARMDDVLNWLPSRLVGLSYALLGHCRVAIMCWRQQAHLLQSPNAGVVMTAGAGALDIVLGGNSVYQGQKVNKPVFGGQQPAQTNDLLRALHLIDKTLFLWCFCIVLYGFYQWMI